jgi:hypothetical protein
MSTMSGDQVVDYLGTIRRELIDELARLQSAQAAQPRQLGEIDKEAEAAWTHILGVLLPSLEPRVLDAAAGRLALPTVSAVATAARRQQRQQQLLATLAQIEAAPEYRNRESLVNEAEIRMPALDENIAPLRQSVEALQDEPMWDELVREGYGTPGYGRKWYQVSYYRHWKFGDRIVDAHGQRMGARDFGRLRAKALDEMRALQAFESERQELLGRNERIRSLVEQHYQTRGALERLDGWVLEQSRALAREHLAALSLADLTPLVASDPALLVAAKRLHGAQAKHKYLDAIGEEWLRKPTADVQRRLEKVSRGIEKFARPSKRHLHFDRAVIEQKYGLPVEKWRQRWQRYQTTSQEIIVFNRYEPIDPLTQFLWWDMMTHSHHGNFIPDVADYHQHDYHQEHDAYVQSGSGSDLSLSDAS